MTSRVMNGNDHWSRLWRTGALHSCAASSDGNYQGQIAAFWEQQCIPLADGARVVDIGTGNGPLPLLIRAFAKARNIDLDLHGVDIADVDPARDVKGQDYAGIRFHPCTSADALPFDDDSVDLIVSQYGFEYAPRAAAVDELIRVLAPSRGRIALVVHATDSVIHRVSARQHEAAVFVLEESDIWRHCEALIEVVGKAQRHGHAAMERLADNAAAESVRQGFNQAALALEQFGHRHGMPHFVSLTMRHLGHVLATLDRQGAAVALSALEGARQALNAERIRLRQMLEVALTSTDLQALGDAFGVRGFQTSVTPLDEAGARLGYAMVAQDG